MEALILSRIQFGLALTFHFIYPATTLGLTLIMLIAESAYIWKKDPAWRSINIFLSKILALVFSMGVATGIILPFTFGTSWSRFSIFTGGIFGLQLTIETVTAFALESFFLAIVLFGRKKVSPRVYLLSVFLVFLGSHLSAFWIISANSFMQTPAGYALDNGRLVLTSLFDAVFNPSTVIRFVHTVTGAWITGSVFTGAVCSFLILKKYSIEFTRRLMPLCIIILSLTAAAQPIIGHAHIMNVLRYQPEKDAAYEGIFKTQKGAPLYVFGIPDEKNERINFGLYIPKALSFLESFDFDAEVKGLNDIPENDRPPVNIIFTTFHIMVPISGVLATVAIAGLYLWIRRRLTTARWYCRVMIAITPLPYIANEMGWIGAEMGRQPWTVYGLMRTADASSTAVSAGATAVSLAVIGTLYLSIFIISIITLITILKNEALQGGQR